jgi:hypothetical protein
MKKYIGVTPFPPGLENVSTSHFIEIVAASFQDNHIVVERLGRLASEYTKPAERRRKSRAWRDDLIRKLADYYPKSLGSNGIAERIARDLANPPGADRMPPAQISLLQEIIQLYCDADRGLGYENIRLILRPPLLPQDSCSSSRITLPKLKFQNDALATDIVGGRKAPKLHPIDNVALHRAGVGAPHSDKTPNAEVYRARRQVREPPRDTIRRRANTSEDFPEDNLFLEINDMATIIKSGRRRK